MGFVKKCPSGCGVGKVGRADGEGFDFEEASSRDPSL